MKKILTLCIIHDHPRVLLGLKKRGFGQGRWNGFGGKVEAGETVEQAALRELAEEAKVRITEIKKHGIIEFEFIGETEILEVHIFKGLGLAGEPTETEEMKPQWFDIKDIPFEKMWPDDAFWLPLFLEDKIFKGKFLFKDSNTILETNLIEVENL